MKKCPASGMNWFFYIYFVYFWGSRYFLGTGTTMYVINERIHLLHTFSCIKSWVLDLSKSRLWSIPNITSCYVPSNLEWVMGSWPISFQLGEWLGEWLGKCLCEWLRNSLGLREWLLTQEINWVMRTGWREALDIQQKSDIHWNLQ